MLHKYIRVHKYKTRSTEYCKYCVYSVVQNFIQNSLKIYELFSNIRNCWGCVYISMLVMVMKQPFHSSDLRVLAGFGMETFPVKQEWNLFMLFR